jgi:ribonuclease BN (tRNA processing enzyme)
MGNNVEANVPTLAYRVRAGRFSIVFSGDQTGRDRRFVEFATGADVLVVHFPLSTLASEAQAQIHATPAVVGQVARDAKVRRLVLSHFIQAYPDDAGREGLSLSGLDRNIAEVKKYYSGPIVQADDLQCISLR